MADIRSFFTGAKSTKPSSKPEKSAEKKKHSNGEKLTNGEETKKKKKRIIIDSDSDEEPLPAKLRKEKSQPRDSSEEPIPPTPEMKKKHKDKHSHKENTSEKHKERSSENHKEKSSKPPEKKSVLNPTTAGDFFSSTSASVPVKRKKESDGDDPPPKKEKSSTVSTNGDQHRKEKHSSEEHKKKEKEKFPMDVDQKNHGKEKERASEKEASRKKEMTAEKSPSKPHKSPTVEKSPKVRTEEKVKKEESDSAKKSSLASKLSSKVKDSDGFMSAVNAPPKNQDKTKSPKSKEANASKTSGEETKMKQSLTNYIDQAKENEKKAAKKQKEKAEKISPEKTTPAKTPAKTPSASTEGEAGDSETPKASSGKKNYWAYKARAAPTALGTKSLPELRDTTLEGLTFVITGVLEAFDREEVQDYIKRYGGKVTSAVSGKTSYLIVGREPGESKITKAEKVGTKRLDEDGFLELCESKAPKVKSSPTKSPSKSSKSESKSPKPSKTESPKVPKTEYSKSSNTDSPKVKNENLKKSGMEDGKAVLDRLKGMKSSPSSSKSPSLSSSSGKSTPNTQSPVVSTPKSPGSSLLWVDKYKPKTMKQIVGQQGEKSNANKLKKWLLDWKTNNSPGAPKKNFNAAKETGSLFRAALLSGPPGVGKTTTATMVCEDVGFSYIEMNASDTRGKKALETEIKESLSNVTVDGMIAGKHDSGKNHVLIMDEVDGMAGNEDRGGMQELIQLIKKSQIPIICMCNDRNSQKVRSLANYTFDLRCYKPRVEQIKAFALSVACKEGVKIPPQAMENIVVGANQDIRQVLHNLQMWTSTDKTMNYDESKAAAKEAQKNIKIDNFEITRRLFSAKDAPSVSINDRVGLFFNDYSFVPLFVQENYASVNLGGSSPRATLETLSRAADSIADGDHVDRILRSQQAWKLLPMQAMFSTVIPSLQMNGYMGNRIDFPKWLGKNSSKNKHDRILQELKMHMAISADCMKADVNMDYLPILKHKLTTPLVDPRKEANDAVKEVISFMDDYNLNREDWDNIVDIGKWGDEADVTSKIPTKVKSAFTRLYNKESHKTPYAMHQAAKKQKATAADTAGMEGDEDEALNNEEEEDEDDVSKDAMIKVKKDKPTASSSKTSKSKSSDSKSSKGKAADSKAKASGKKKK